MRSAPAPFDTAPASRSAGGLRQVIADGWALARPFWRAPGERRAWLLLGAVIALTLGSVWLNLQFSQWNNSFYNSLQNHDLPGFWRQLGVFGVLATAFIVVAVYRQYLQQLLFMRWRTWLTHALQDRWLQPGTAYRLGARLVDGIDNPDQRISEDARGFVSSTLDIGLGLLNATLTLLSFVGILWGLSGRLRLPIGTGVLVPGAMVWVALAYSLAGTWVAQRLGRPLVGLNGQQQQVEADFRYALVQLRDHAEAVALAGGERREGARLRQAFEAVRHNWTALIRTTKRLTWFSAGYGQLANVFPILAAAPRYFAGALQLGGLMQTAQAFGQVQGALSWYIDAYPRLAEWRATVHRLSAFHAAMALEGQAAATPGIDRLSHAGDALQLVGLRVLAPDGRVLVHDLDQAFARGQRWLIAGPSGSGKSTLIRALSGLVRQGQGQIRLPARARLMFVPQRPYLPAGALREVLAYPAEWRDFSRRDTVRAMRRAGLGRRVAELDMQRRWSSILSPGEQQRIHFARVLLHRPDWVFLDESSAALDEASEQGLYRALARHCPDTTVISIGHRSTLHKLHDQLWSMPAPAEAAAHGLVRPGSGDSAQASGPGPATPAAATHAGPGLWPRSTPA